MVGQRLGLNEWVGSTLHFQCALQALINNLTRISAATRLPACPSASDVGGSNDADPRCTQIAAVSIAPKGTGPLMGVMFWESLQDYRRKDLTCGYYRGWSKERGLAVDQTFSFSTWQLVEEKKVKCMVSWQCGGGGGGVITSPEPGRSHLKSGVHFLLPYLKVQFNQTEYSLGQ